MERRGEIRRERERNLVKKLKGADIKRKIRRYGEKGGEKERERHMVTKLEGEDRERDGGRERKRESEER